MEPILGPGHGSGLRPGNPPGVQHTIMGAPTAITAFIGWASQGPAGEPVMVESWLQYVTTFGGLLAGSFLGYAVNGFFSNGGTQAYIIRVAGTNGTMLVPGDGEFETQLTGPSGFAVLGGAPIFNLLCVPGETDAGVVGKLQDFCAQQRAFLIVDAAKTAVVGIGSAGLSKTGPADGAGTSLAGPNASYSAFYFPWVVAPDPLSGEAPTLFPPSGFVAGIYATTDSNSGVWKAPAGPGATLQGVTGLQLNLTDEQSTLLSQLGVNCLREFPVNGNVVWGARTMAGADGGDTQWQYVPIRRLALYIESSLYQGTQWAVFEPNNETLWTKLQQSIEGFMQGLLQQGALVGTTSAQAYFVKCDATCNPASSVALGVVNIAVGFAPLVPAEFLVIQIAQKAGQASR